jgi:hypothetical protein
MINLCDNLTSETTMHENHSKPVADYKSTCLIMGFINLLWVFGALWAFYGLPVVLVLAATLNHLITRLDLKLARAQYYGPR